MPAAGEVELFEHYIDRPAELDRVGINPEAEIEWSAVGQGESGVREAFEGCWARCPSLNLFRFTGRRADAGGGPQREPSISAREGSGALPESFRNGAFWDGWARIAGPGESPSGALESIIWITPY